MMQSLRFEVARFAVCAAVMLLTASFTSGATNVVPSRSNWLFEVTAYSRKLWLRSQRKLEAGLIGLASEGLWGAVPGCGSNVPNSPVLHRTGGGPQNSSSSSLISKETTVLLSCFVFVKPNPLRQQTASLVSSSDQGGTRRVSHDSQREKKLDSTAPIDFSIYIAQEVQHPLFTPL